MATLAQLQQALQNPNARKMLDVIAQAEGVKHGYNTLFGNERFDNLSTHPNIAKGFRQTDGRTNSTTAAGRYQFLNRTWNNVAKRYGLKDFSPANQDLAALALIAGRGALDDVLQGNFTGAVGKLGKEWASLPTSPYAQNKRSWDFINAATGGKGGQQQANQPQFVDLTALGYKAPSTETAKPNFVDLRKLGYQDSTQRSAQPQFVDLKALGYEG